MKTTKQLFILFLAVTFTLISASLFSQTIDRNAVDGCIYVKFKNDVPLSFSVKKGKVMVDDVNLLRGLKTQYQITSMRNTFWQTTDSKLHRIFKIEFDAKEKVEDLINELKQSPEIEYAEKAPYFHISFSPNDPNYATAANRWHLDKINATTAWDISQGSSTIKIAVIDNAIDINHPEITPKLAAAIDLGDGDNDPTPPAVSTIWSHGTHTSGLACGATNNGVGTASIGFDCSLMAIKAGKDADGGQGVSAMFEGITWAADNGADVISMSFGGPSFFQTMQMIIDYAYNKGCVLVAAAGNNGNGDEDPNNINYIGYPAACNHVISVGATNGNDVAASFSEYGDWIDVMAPGGYQNGEIYILGFYLPNGPAVYSLAANNSYTNMQGTSMACPIAAGLCGLMLSVDPALTPEKVEQYLKATCFNIESLQNAAHQGNVGAGRIDAFAALNMVTDSLSSITADFTCSGNYINVGGSVDFTDLSTGTAVSWNWDFPGGTPSSSVDQNPQNIVYNAPGTYSATLTVSDGTNNSTETKTSYINVQVPANSAWIEQASGFASMYRGAYQISIVSDSVVWATAIDGTNGAPVNEFTRTINAGNLWVPGTITPGTGLAPANISAITDQKAWIAMYPTSGAGGQVYYTNDGGSSWTNQNNGSMFVNGASFLNVVHFFNENEGFCMGDPINNEFEVYTTNDGGVTWNVVAAANLPDAQSGEMGWTGVYDAFNNVAWFGTNKGRIFKSSDKGQTWEVLTPGLTDVQKITFNNENNGITQQIVYNTGTGAITTLTMKVTHDGGTTWTTVTPGTGMGKSDICAVPNLPGKYYSVGTNGAASGSALYNSSYSLDYGNTWTVVDTAVQYISVKFLDDYTGWAGGFSINATTSGIFKWDSNVLINENQEENISSLVYPNPSHGEIRINTSVLDLGSQIDIYDMLGNKVHESKISDLETKVDLHFLPKGMYLIQISTNKKVENHKLIIK